MTNSIREPQARLDATGLNKNFRRASSDTSSVDSYRDADIDQGASAHVPQPAAEDAFLVPPVNDADTNCKIPFGDCPPYVDASSDLDIDEISPNLEDICDKEYPSSCRDTALDNDELELDCMYYECREAFDDLCSLSEEEDTDVSEEDIDILDFYNSNLNCEIYVSSPVFNPTVMNMVSNHPELICNFRGHGKRLSAFHYALAADKSFNMDEWNSTLVLCGQNFSPTLCLMSPNRELELNIKRPFSSLVNLSACILAFSSRAPMPAAPGGKPSFSDLSD